jgi:hypothetical protein
MVRSAAARPDSVGQGEDGHDVARQCGGRSASVWQSKARLGEVRFGRASQGQEMEGWAC